MENIFDQEELGSAKGTNFDEDGSLRIQDGGCSGENQLVEHINGEKSHVNNSGLCHFS